MYMVCLREMAWIFFCQSLIVCHVACVPKVVAQNNVVFFCWCVWCLWCVRCGCCVWCVTCVYGVCVLCGCVLVCVRLHCVGVCWCVCVCMCVCVCVRSEEHTSELQSHLNLVCRLL